MTRKEFFKLWRKYKDYYNGRGSGGAEDYYRAQEQAIDALKEVVGVPEGIAQMMVIVCPEMVDKVLGMEE